MFLQPVLSNLIPAERYPSLEIALSTIGTSDLCTLVVSKPIEVTTAIVVPENVTLVCNPGGYITFSGAGALTGLKKARPEWFGAVGDGSTDDFTAFTKAWAAAKEVKLRGVTYVWKYTTALAASATIGDVTITGVPYQTTIKADWTGVSDDTVVKTFVSVSDDSISINDVRFDGNKAQVEALFTLSDNTKWAFYWLGNTSAVKVKKSNFSLRNVDFLNSPGSYTNHSSLTTAGLIESFDINIGVWDNVNLENITRTNCDTTFHVAGAIHTDIDDDDYWTTNVSVRNFRVYQNKSPNSGQWQGFGTYGVKNITIDGMYVEKSRLNGLNFEWTLNAVVNGLTAKDCILGGVGGFGYNKNIVVNSPTLLNCGIANAASAGNSIFTPQVTFASASPIRFVSGSWYTGGITGSPIDIKVIHPRFTLPADTQLITTERSASANTGALDITYSQTAVIVGMEDIELAQTFIADAPRYFGNLVQVTGARYIPCALDKTGQPSAGITVTPSAGRDSYTVAAAAQYNNVAINLPPGDYAFSLRAKYVDTDWSFQVSTSAGASVAYRDKITAAASDITGFVTIGGVFRSAVGTQLKIQNETNGAGSVIVSNLMIAQLRGVSADQPIWDGKDCRWNGNHIVLGKNTSTATDLFHMWVNQTTGKWYSKYGAAPTNDSDGTIIGTQS